jgi:hypothetical protein
MKHIFAMSLLGATAWLCGCNSATHPTNQAVVTTTNAPVEVIEPNMNPTITKTDEEWKKELTPQQYAVLRQKGTERAFTGEYWNTKDKGKYRCAGCGEVLFESDTKFDSGCGRQTQKSSLKPRTTATS